MTRHPLAPALAVVAALVLGAMTVSSSGQAADAAVYDCTFDKGASWSFEKNAFQADATSSLTFRISKVSRETQSAELTTATGRTDLKLVAAIDAIHFIEVTVSGYLTLTTLYGEGARIPAVHSRHVGIAGQPVGSQLHGFCDRK